MDFEGVLGLKKTVTAGMAATGHEEIVFLQLTGQMIDVNLFTPLACLLEAKPAEGAL